jgi:hypothetical protein
MRLNIRLMGILHGILVIALIGYAVLRGSTRIRGKNAAAAILLGLVIGLSLVIIGYVGVFFGRLIKSAVSRQREFLADASSVQVTRNPSGLAGALKKIGGTISGAKLENRHAEEASHLFFGNALNPSWFGLLSTHPPLAERIRRLEPGFDGTFAAAAETPLVHAEEIGALSQAAASPASAAPSVPLRPSEAVSRAGTLEPEQLAYATSLIAALPARLRTDLRDPFGAQAAMFSLLLSKDADAQRVQYEALNALVEEALVRETVRIHALIEPLGREIRLPLVDMALPALKQLSSGQYQRFRDAVCTLIEADQEVQLFEFTINRILLRHLDPHFFGAPKREEKFRSLYQVRDECSTLLSALSHVGDSDENKSRLAFAAGTPFLGGAAATFRPLEECDLGSLDTALEKLAHLTPPLKKRVLEACAACVARDGRATLEELELFRAVADALDCPIPPFLTS